MSPSTLLTSVALIISAIPARADDAPAPPSPPSPPDAAPAPAAGKKSVVVLDLEAAGVQPNEAKLITGLVVDALAKYEELDVLGRADIEQMAALEADKQLMGCAETSCLAEIAGALGAKFVIFGRVGTLDELVLVQLNLFDASAGKPVGRQDIRVSRLSEVAPMTPGAVGRLVQPLTGREPPADPVLVVETEESPLTPALRWGGLGTAGLGLAAAGVTGSLATWQLMELNSPTRSAADKNAVVKPLGAAMVITAGVATVVTVVGVGVFGASFLGGG